MPYPVVERVRALAEELKSAGLDVAIIKKALGAIGAVIPTNPQQAANMPVGGPIYELCRFRSALGKGYTTFAADATEADVQYRKGQAVKAVQAKYVNSPTKQKVKDNIAGAVAQLQGLTGSGSAHQGQGNQEQPPADAVLVADIVIPENSQFALDQQLLSWLGTKNTTARSISVRITRIGHDTTSKQFIDIVSGTATLRPSPEDKARDHVATTLSIVGEIRAVVNEDGTGRIKEEFKSLARDFR